MCHITTTTLIRICPICYGIGAIDDGRDSYRNLRDECPRCNGSGTIQVDLNE